MAQVVEVDAFEVLPARGLDARGGTLDRFREDVGSEVVVVRTPRRR